jgi:FkbM family methyltransferase
MGASRLDLCPSDHRLRPRLAGWSDAITSGLTGGAHFAPFAAALGRARARGHLRLAVLGGSITAGTGASQARRSWPDRVSSWIEGETGLAVRLHNAGLGATGSAIGALRFERDVLAFRPDLLVVEFAVNDIGDPHAAACLEGLLRRALGSPVGPAIALLLLATRDGQSAHDAHLALACHLGLPAASVPAAIAALARRGEPSDPGEWWADPVHPADLGHALAADLLAEQLRRGFSALAGPFGPLPGPLHGEVFSRVRWESGARWAARGEGFWPGPTGHFGASLAACAPGAWREGDVEGEAVGVVLSRRRGRAGRALVAVDDAPPVVVECWQDPDWGGRPQWVLAAEGLAPGRHRLRIAVLAGRAAGSEGHEVEFEAVWGAGRTGRPDTRARPEGNGAFPGADDGATQTPMRDRMKNLVLEAAGRALPPWALARLPSGLAAAIVRDDAMTSRILARVLRPDSCCVDVGCNEGQILQEMVRLAPRGQHHAFEAIPELAAGLVRRFPAVQVHAAAASNAAGETEFHLVENDPGYSGIRRRRYDRPDPQVRVIRVPMVTLDSVVGEGRVDFIKIDVEGAELQVLEGAERTLARCRPTMIFEHGRGAAEFYETTPAKIFALLSGKHCFRIHTLAGYLHGSPPLDLAAFSAAFADGQVWNFVSSP